jgi:hypothetical protein
LKKKKKNEGERMKFILIVVITSGVIFESISPDHGNKCSVDSPRLSMVEFDTYKEAENYMNGLDQCKKERNCVIIRGKLILEKLCNDINRTIINK